MNFVGFSHVPGGHWGHSMRLQEIKNLALQNEMRGRFSFIYLVKQDDEMPLVVLHKHNNFKIMDPTTNEWTFHTQVDVKAENKKIETMLKHLSEELRTSMKSQKALVEFSEQ